MAKQKLTPTAKRMKAARDKRAAMTEDRRKKKAEHQRKRRDAKKAEVQHSHNIEQDLVNLKNEMNEIKSLLKELVSNVH